MPRALRAFARSNAARASSRFAVAVLTDGDVGVGRRRVVAVDRPAHAELRARLEQRRLGPLEGQRQLARLDLDQRRADADLPADLHQHAADDACGLGADPRLVGREQRAGQVDLPLDRHPLDVGRVDGHASARAPPLGPAAAASAGRHARARECRRGSHERQDPPEAGGRCTRESTSRRSARSGGRAGT